MKLAFRWNEWNLDHATKHGVSKAECEEIVRRYNARKIGERKLMVVGRGKDGAWIEVIFILDDDGTVYVIHSPPLTDAEKKRYRKR